MSTSSKEATRNLKRVVEEIKEDDDDELLLWVSLNRKKMKKSYKGSVKGRKGANSKDRLDGAEKLFTDYFSETPRFSEKTFRRRFRMSSKLFLTIMDKLVEANPYFRQKKDAIGVLGCTPHQKMTAAIRMLAYGSPADVLQEYIRTSASTNVESLKQYCETLVKEFGDQYLRPLEGSCLTSILEENESRGFPGCIGSIDCMHWKWKNCPTEWHGQYTGKEKKPTVVLEAVATKDLRIWHFSFGEPGANNDINVLDSSHVMDQFLTYGESHRYVLHGTERSLLYLLADGIYPDWPTFVKSYKAPTTQEEKFFTQEQEACRKDVERAFGVLQAKWRILSYPSLFWYKHTMHSVIKACVIMHNMIIEERISANISREASWDLTDDEDNDERESDDNERENEKRELTEGEKSERSALRSQFVKSSRVRFRDKLEYNNLRQHLIKHIFKFKKKKKKGK